MNDKQAPELLESMPFPVAELDAYLDEHEVYTEATFRRELEELYGLLATPRSAQWLANAELIYMPEVSLQLLIDAGLIEETNGVYRRT